MDLLESWIILKNLNDSVKDFRKKVQENAGNFIANTYPTWEDSIKLLLKIVVQ